MRANAVNLAIFTNALCYFNATPLSVAVLAPCVWGENLACGGAWQGALNSATHNTAWRSEFGNETAKRGKFQWHSTANSVWRNGRCLRAKRKCGSVWVGDFSLVARTFWHTFGLNLKGFFTHFIVVSSHFIVNFSHFFVVFSRLFCSCFSFYHSFNSSFHSQKAFFRAFCFFENFKCFVFGLVIESSFCENGVAIHKFSVIFTFWIATLALLARNDGGFCRSDRSEKSIQIKRKLTIFGYFATLSMTANKSV